MRYRNLTTHLGPIIMLAAGLTFAWGAIATLDLGSFRRMGPGAYPLLVGGLLSVLAIISLLQNLRTPMDVDRSDYIAVLGVVAGVASFAFLTPRLGVLPATAIAVFLTGSAIPGFRWHYRIVLAIGVAIGVWLIFVKGLGMPFIAIKGV
jgi:hypothetical protein